MKIRIMALMLVLAVVFSTLTMTISATEQTGLVSPASVTAGEEFTAEISVPANTALMAGVQFTMVFDNTALELVSLEVPTLTAVENDKYTDVITANKDGKVNVQYGGVAGENTINVSAGLTIKYNFKALKEGDTTLRLTNGFLYAYAEDGYSEIDYTPADMVTEVAITVTKAPCTTHNWGEWVVTEATCIAEGSKVRTCTVEGCGETETEVLEMLEHTLGEWTYDTENHWKVCSVCTGEVDKATHEFDNEEDMICDTCGYDRSCKHENKETIAAVAPTCSEVGYTEGEKCSDCGFVTVEPEEIEKLPHTEETLEAVEATCTATGLTEGKKCSVCGEILVAQEETAMVDHTWGDPVVVDATCTEAGSKTYKCTVCEVGEKVETIEKLGHDFGEAVVTTPATCTAPGEKTGYCSRCNETIVEEIPALGHDFGDWIQTKAPTEDEEGEERRDCSRCDAYETRTLEALGTPFMDEWYWTMVMLHNQSYEIEADAEDGDITPNGVTKVKFAQSITYTITPDEGYKIEAVYVDGKNVGAVSEYTFKRVTKDHTIYAVCAEIEEEPAIGDEIVSTYVDVDVDDWFYDAVETVTAHGLMNGTGDGKFSPEVSTNRAMLVTILWRIEGEADAEPSAFTDVADDMWYTAAIDWAAANGIVNGYEDGTFGPEKAVTREQVMAILHRYAAYRGVTEDVAVSMIAQYDCSVWAENDVNWADMHGLLDNLGVDVTDMTAEASRAEIAAYLADFCVNVIQ